MKEHSIRITSPAGIEEFLICWSNEKKVEMLAKLCDSLDHLAQVSGANESENMISCMVLNFNPTFFKTL